LTERFGGLGQGILVSPPAPGGDDDAFGAVIAALQSA
jgi:hypothetical protein